MKTSSRLLVPLSALVLVLTAAAAPARADSLALSEVFKRVNPAVVEIVTKETDLPPLQAGPGEPVAVGGLGSGVLISPDGKVLTAAHVVQTADAIQVRFLTGETIDAKVISSEPMADVALLQLSRAPTAPFVAKLGDSDAVEVGSPIFVIGAPLGASHTLTQGIVSARRRANATSGLARAEFFQTDAAINQGNSGGPMFDMQGQVIGIVSYILSRTGGSDGLGFAVTSKVARLLLETRSFWSGVNGYLLSGDMAKVFNVPSPGSGLLIQRVATGSPGERLGLKAGTVRAVIGDEEIIVGGDVILSVLGIPLTDAASFGIVREKITSLAPTEPVQVTILRGGKIVTLSGTAQTTAAK